MNSDNEFIDIFNAHYPFERYIMKTPKSLDFLFDDMVLTEIFIPSTEILLRESERGIPFWAHVDGDEIYVKVKGPAGEMRVGYFDFAEHIREEIRGLFIEDLGNYEYQSLYVEDEEGEDQDLLVQLNIQYNKIIEKYGECCVKKSCLNSFEIMNGEIIESKINE